MNYHIQCLLVKKTCRYFTVTSEGRNASIKYIKSLIKMLYQQIRNSKIFKTIYRYLMDYYMSCWVLFIFGFYFQILHNN